MKLLTISAFVLTSLTIAAPAFALDGGDAYEQCQATPGCVPYVNGEGNILIYGPKGGTVWCKSSNTECEVVRYPERMVTPIEPEEPKQHFAVIGTTFGSLSGDSSEGAPTHPLDSSNYTADTGSMSNAPEF